MTTPEERLAAARFVAEHWRDAMMGSAGSRPCAHPLAMVLAALGGEADPNELGVGDAAAAFASAMESAGRPGPDRLYLDLKGALERLNRAEVSMASNHQAEVGTCTRIIERLGVFYCGEAWSRFDTPEPPPVFSMGDRVETVVLGEWVGGQLVGVGEAFGTWHVRLDAPVIIGNGPLVRHVVRSERDLRPT